MSSRSVLTIKNNFIKVIVHKNNQNVGDLITSPSHISSFDEVPGINKRKPTKMLKIVMQKINADLRHLYLSVTAPTIGLTNNPGSGIIVRIKPTMNAE